MQTDGVDIVNGQNECGKYHGLDFGRGRGDETIWMMTCTAYMGCANCTEATQSSMWVVLQCAKQQASQYASHSGWNGINKTDNQSLKGCVQTNCTCYMDRLFGDGRSLVRAGTCAYLHVQTSRTAWADSPAVFMAMRSAVNWHPKWYLSSIDFLQTPTHAGIPLR